MLVNLLTQRQEIEETVNQLGLRIDAKEWGELDEVLAESVELDYVSLFNGQVERLSRAEVVSRWRTLLSPLKATQHIITNMLVIIKGGATADCTGNVVATHVHAMVLGDKLWTVGGRYDFKLLHEAGRWKISAIKLTVLWTEGDPQVLNIQK